MAASIYPSYAWSCVLNANGHMCAYMIDTSILQTHRTSWRLVNWPTGSGSLTSGFGAAKLSKPINLGSRREMCQYENWKLQNGGNESIQLMKANCWMQQRPIRFAFVTHPGKPALGQDKLENSMELIEVRLMDYRNYSVPVSLRTLQCSFQKFNYWCANNLFRNGKC